MTRTQPDIRPRRPAGTVHYRHLFRPVRPVPERPLSSGISGRNQQENGRGSTYRCGSHQCRQGHHALLLSAALNPSYRSGLHADSVQVANRNNLFKKIRLSAVKREVLEELEMLIIDEVSMLRSDQLDCMDAILGGIRRNDQPFGGVQVIFIGDLYQLPPVVTDNDKHIRTNIMTVLSSSTPKCCNRQNCCTSNDEGLSPAGTDLRGPASTRFAMQRHRSG